jgi:hypothetical protein
MFVINYYRKRFMDKFTVQSYFSLKKMFSISLRITYEESCIQYSQVLAIIYFNSVII